MKNNIFRKSSIDRVSSPEQLNDYIKVSSPSVWVVLIAVIILLISVLVWGFFGKLETKVHLKGFVNSDEVTCFVGDTNGIIDGQKALVEEISGEVISVSKEPYTKEDIILKYDNDKIPDVIEGKQAYEIKIKMQKQIDEKDCDVFIITNTINPISFLLN